jgi:predicted O-methyltransferase YrrM
MPVEAALGSKRTWTGYDDHTLREYRPHLYKPADGLFINAQHEAIFAQLSDMRGPLEQADYFKLYELGYFAEGTVLEIGRLAAKSTVLIAMGLRDAGKSHTFCSIDVKTPPIAEQNLETHGLRDRVLLLEGDSADTVKLISGRFDSVFVDGDHSYEGVTRDIFALRNRVLMGGAVLFHDYYHGANADPANEGMKVAKAVDKHTPHSRLGFRGGTGAIAVYEQL